MEKGQDQEESITEIDLVWDWIVIGTGMGGSTFGHALAKAGRRVLFIEKGADQRVNQNKKAGNYLESLVPSPVERSAKDYKNAGRSHTKIWDATRGRWIKPILGSGTGGSSALYGMVLERFWKEDFEPGRWYKGSKSALPERWPILFDEMEPYYKEAEALFSVTSLRSDPLRSHQEFNYSSRPPLSPEGTRLMSSLINQGLHPYTLPLARKEGTSCPFCSSFLCEYDCKNDAAKICLEPALRNHGAALLCDAEVLEIAAEGPRVSGVEVNLAGRSVFIRAHNIALAAGAILSPVLLLKSRSPQWPQGLGNASGLVGRNLMRHYIDLIGIFSPAPPNEKGDEKEIGCNDFYLRDGEKFGTLADFGTMPPLPVILEDLDNDVATEGLMQRVGWIMIRPFVLWALKHILKRYRFMALMTEDLPFPENRVEEGGPGADITIHYSISPEEESRIRSARALVRKALGRWSTLLLSNAKNSKLLAHACGTCRMGEDPGTSVVNRMNRAHGLENLYIVDSSFFPSSGGVNPALTIAANALRVAQYIIDTQADAPMVREFIPPVNAGPEKRPKILFVADAVALSHPARLLQIARQLDPTLYDIHFASDPRYRAVLGPAPFSSHDIESIPSTDFDRIVSRGGVFFTEDVIEKYVQQELALCETLQPDIVIGEFRPSLSISTRLLKIPYIGILNAYYSPTTHMRHIIPEYVMTEWLPRKMAQGLFNLLRLWGYAKHARPVNAVRRRHGLPPLLGDLRHTLGDADWTLFPDIERLFPGRPISETQRYMGPISWTPEVPLPDWWDSLPTDRPVIYANLGSSGRNGVLQRVLDALGTLPVTVVAATAGRQTKLVPPANAFLTHFLPGKEAARRSALVITNGGNMSGYQALSEGKPFIGLASNVDQFLSMATFEDAGVAKLLRARTFAKKDLISAVQTLMNDSQAQKTASLLSTEMAAAPNDVFQSVLEEALKTPRAWGKTK
ncbi:MAG: GMC family oxidoreductase N-terminal domain-containing protein [Elusimicrobia bacterium]|nr:GMC family oxidoreductase N-terminal domain-containing protein [Elusimicrobiota bacterium]